MGLIGFMLPVCDMVYRAECAIHPEPSFYRANRVLLQGSGWTKGGALVRDPKRYEGRGTFWGYLRSIGIVFLHGLKDILASRIQGPV